jgi:hypothetical protein
MADFFYNLAKKMLHDATLDLTSDVIQVMLVTSSYVANPDHDFVDEAGTDDPIDHELSGTGYTGGWGGSGRKTLASIAITEDDANDRAKFDAADVAWTALGPAGTAAAALLIRKGTSDDTDALLIAHFDTGFPVITNGSDVTLAWDALGLDTLE